MGWNSGTQECSAKERSGCDPDSQCLSVLRKRQAALPCPFEPASLMSACALTLFKKKGARPRAFGKNHPREVRSLLRR